MTETSQGQTGPNETLQDPSNRAREHPRQLIRQALVERLSSEWPASVTGANDQPTRQKEIRIYANRLKPLFEKHLPCVLVYTLGETVEAGSYEGDGHKGLSRTLKMAVEAMVSGAEGHDDRLDAMALEIEKRLDDWWIKGFEPCQFRLTESDFTAIEEGAVPFLACRLSFDCTYTSSRNQKEIYV